VALKDLLWACPGCGLLAGLRPAGSQRAQCTGCGTVYGRSRGHIIEAVRSEGSRERAPPETWLARLPDLRASLPAGDHGPERAAVRIAGPARPVRRGRELLGWAERFGRAREGTIRLAGDVLRFAPDGAGPGSEFAWAVEELTAIQPSSSTLQVKVRGQPVVSIRFADSSVRWWEALLQERVRRRWTETGRGRVIEYQPRITAS
jgi:hypothetical protein